MTTFTTEDRKSAYDPGMGCVVPNTAGDDLEETRTSFTEEIKEYQIFKSRHLKTSKGIVDFIRGPKC